MTKPQKGSFSYLIGLKHVEEWQALGIVAFTYFLLHTRWSTFTLNEHWLVYWTWFWLNGTFCWFCATIVHNSIHVPPFVHAFGNKIWQYALAISYGYPVATLTAAHNQSHHRFTQGPRDVHRTDKMRFSYNGFNLLFYVPFLLRSDVWQGMKWMQLAKKNKMAIYWQCQREAVLLIAFNIAFALADWRKYLHVVFLPQLLAKWGFLSINILQHDGCPTPEVDKWNFSRNFIDPKLNFFTCNNGYHTAHHLNAGMHWSELKKYHEKKVKPFIHPNLDCDSILKFLVYYFLIPEFMYEHAGRRNHKGEPYVLPPYVEDQEWVITGFTKQTYSDGTSL